MYLEKKITLGVVFLVLKFLENEFILGMNLPWECVNLGNAFTKGMNLFWECIYRRIEFYLGMNLLGNEFIWECMFGNELSRIVFLWD